MRYFAVLAASALLIAASGNNAGSAGPSAPGLAPITNELSSIQLVEQKKSDTVTKRIKRAWKDLVGYKFNVACPIFFPVNQRTCTETGKDRAEARAKCASQNQFCLISDAN
jgi:hypothetical protein